MRIGSWRFKLYFAWYDLWIGAYYDRDKRRLYIGVPLVGVVIQFGAKELLPESLCERRR